MIITEIKKIGKGERYSIFVDGVFNCTLQAEILVKEKLKTGEDISEERLTSIKLENGRIAAFSQAISYLEKFLRTEKQLREYLKEKGYLDESIDEAIEKLKEYGYINDELFAESYIRTYQNKKGKKKLKFELMQKGVDGEVVSQKLDELLDDDASFDCCLTMLKKYLKNKPVDKKLRAKAFNHLASKGFESSIILKALNEALFDENEQ